MVSALRALPSAVGSTSSSSGDRGSQFLLGGLRELVQETTSGGSNQRPRSANAARSGLWSASSFAQRANERAATARPRQRSASEVNSDPKLVPLVPRVSSLPDQRDSEIEERKARRCSQLAEEVEEHEHRYQELVVGIENLLSRGTATGSEELKPLHGGELVEGKMRARERCFFVLQLPNRVVNITITLTRVCGGLPDIYGTTVAGKRPTAEDHDMAAEEDGEIFFRHDPEAFQSAPGQPAQGPPKTLQLCIQADALGCEYRLRCAVRRAGTEHSQMEEDAAHRVGQSPSQADMLAMRLQRLQQKVARPQSAPQVKSPQRPRKDFLALNQENVQRYSHRSRAERRATMASHRAAQRSLVVKRRQEIEKATEDNLNRYERRHRLREAQARELEEEGQRDQLRGRWMSMLLAVSYLQRLIKESQHQIVRVAAEVKRIRACRRIQTWMMGVVFSKRQRRVYLNAIKLRVALQAFCRTQRVAIAHMAQIRAKWFVAERCSRDFDEARVVQPMRELRRQVKILQRGYRRMMRRREAWVEGLMKLFTAKELTKTPEEAAKGPRGNAHHALTLVVPPVPQMEDPRESPSESKLRRQKMGQKVPLTPALRALRMAREGGQTRDAQAGGPLDAGTSNASIRLGARSTLSVTMPPSPKSLAPPKTDAVVRALQSMQGDGGVPACDLAYEGWELLPDIVRRYVLMEFVGEMQRTYRNRLRKHEAMQFSDEAVERDMKQLGFRSRKSRDTTPELKRPKLLEASRLRGLYVQAYDAYLSGFFSPLIQRRRYLLNQVIKLWSAAARRSALQRKNILMMKAPVDGGAAPLDPAAEEPPRDDEGPV